MSAMPRKVEGAKGEYRAIVVVAGAVKLVAYVHADGAPPNFARMIERPCAMILCAPLKSAP
jgi:hypothetical protein